jgi:hypothetical protein
VGDVRIGLRAIDSDRMATLFDHVMVKGHTVTLHKVGENFLEIACTDDNGNESCGEEGEPWWDHWDFNDSYVAYVRDQIDKGIQLNGD